MGQGSGLTVLLVEDNPDMRYLFRRGLEDQGLHVIEAENGMVAITLLRQRQVNLVLSDVEMPVLGGIGLRDWLSEQRPGLPILLMSAAVRLGDMPGALDKLADRAMIYRTVAEVLGVVPVLH